MELTAADMNYQLGILQKEIPNWAMLNRSSYYSLCVNIVSGNMESHVIHDSGKSDFVLVQTVLATGENGTQNIIKNICELPKDSAFFDDIVDYDEVMKQIANAASEKDIPQSNIQINFGLSQYVNGILKNNDLSEEQMYTFYNELYRKLVNQMIYNSFTVDAPSDNTNEEDTDSSSSDDENAVIHAAVVEPDIVE